MTVAAAGRLRTLRRAACLAVALGVIWRLVRYAMNFPLWGDEAFVAISLMRRDFRGLLPRLEYGQIAPLGFMWIEWLAARLIGLSEYALRLAPVIIGLATIPAYWCFLRRVAPPRVRFLAIAIFTASYFVVRYAVELKPYGADVLVSILLLGTGWNVLTRPSRARWLSLTVTATLGIWFSYPSTFVATGIGLVLLTRAARTPALRMGLPAYSLLAGVSVVGMYLFSARPQAASASWLTDIAMWQPSFPPVTQPWKLPQWVLLTHAGEMLAYPAGGRNGASAASFLFAVVGAVAMWRRQRALLYLLLSPLPFLFFAAALKRYPYGGSIRTSLFMAPALCLLIATGMSRCLAAFTTPRRSDFGRVIFACVMACFAGAGMIRDVIRPYHQEADLANRRAMAALRTQTRPADQWIIFNSLTDSPYAPNLYAWGGSGARFRYYIARFGPVPVQWSPPPTRVAARPSRQTWLIAYRDNKAPFPQEAWNEYRRNLFGPASSHQTFRLGPVEAIEVYTHP